MKKKVKRIYFRCLKAIWYSLVIISFMLAMVLIDKDMYVPAYLSILYFTVTAYLSIKANDTQESEGKTK